MELITALEQLIVAAEDGQITAGELSKGPVRMVIRELRQWQRSQDGEVLVEIEPGVIALIKVALRVAKGEELDLIDLLLELRNAEVL